MRAEIGKSYMHYKGNEYQVIAIARQEWDVEAGEFVVYRVTHGINNNVENSTWIRPRQEFEGTVVHKEKVVERFTRIDS